MFLNLKTPNMGFIALYSLPGSGFSGQYHQAYITGTQNVKMGERYMGFSLGSLSID